MMFCAAVIVPCIAYSLHVRLRVAVGEEYMVGATNGPVHHCGWTKPIKRGATKSCHAETTRASSTWERKGQELACFYHTTDHVAHHVSIACSMGVMIMSGSSCFPRVKVILFCILWIYIYEYKRAGS
jgi:hypothetical protein